ncbi:MAG: hypothetical protein FWD74_08835, partial [Actinomycetia bacterium]|nr:hypothetical protein [Actinomycetes bacterium]
MAAAAIGLVVVALAASPAAGAATARARRVTALSVNTNPNVNAKITFKGTVTRGTPSHSAVRLQIHATSGWRTVATCYTGSGARFACSVVDTWAGRYSFRAVAIARPGYKPAISPSRAVAAWRVAKATVTTSGPVLLTAATGATATLAGKVSPFRAGATAQLQRLQPAAGSTPAAWKAVANVKIASNGTFSSATNAVAAGTTANFRWYVPAVGSASYLRAAASGAIAVVSYASTTATITSGDQALPVGSNSTAIAGTVSPFAAGTAVSLQRLNGTVWTTVSGTAVTGDGTFEADTNVIADNSSAQFRFVVDANATAKLRQAVSGATTVTVGDPAPPGPPSCSNCPTISSATVTGTTTRTLTITGTNLFDPNTGAYTIMLGATAIPGSVLFMTNTLTAAVPSVMPAGVVDVVVVTNAGTSNTVLVSIPQLVTVPVFSGTWLTASGQSQLGPDYVVVPGGSDTATVTVVAQDATSYSVAVAAGDLSGNNMATTGPNSFAAATPLPPGVTLNALTGVMSGAWPATGGEWKVTVTAANATASSTKTVLVVVKATSPLGTGTPPVAMNGYPGSCQSPSDDVCNELAVNLALQSEGYEPVFQASAAPTFQ